MFHGDDNHLNMYDTTYRAPFDDEYGIVPIVGYRSQKMQAFLLDVLVMAYADTFIGTSSSTVTYLVRWVRETVLHLGNKRQAVTNFGPAGDDEFNKTNPNGGAKRELNSLFENHSDKVINMNDFRISHQQLKLIRSIPDGIIRELGRGLDQRLGDGRTTSFNPATELGHMLKPLDWQAKYTAAKNEYKEMYRKGDRSMGWFKALVLFRINPWRAYHLPHAPLFTWELNSEHFQWKMNDVNNVLPGRKAGTEGLTAEVRQWQSLQTSAASSKARPPPPPAAPTSGTKRGLMTTTAKWPPQKKSRS